MVEALVLFESVVNSVWFKKSSIILFLNKADVMAEKIQDANQQVSLTSQLYVWPKQKATYHRCTTWSSSLLVGIAYTIDRREFPRLPWETRELQ